MAVVSAEHVQIIVPNSSQITTTYTYIHTYKHSVLTGKMHILPQDAECLKTVFQWSTSYPIVQNALP